MSKRRFKNRLPRRRGVMMLDVTVGLILIGIVATLFTTALGAHNKAANRLADARSADRLAEHVMTQLQTGTALPEIDPQTMLNVRVVNDPPAPGGARWAQVTATVHGRRATLWGAVPASAARRQDLPKPGDVEAQR
jgi:hypothetical protein